MTRVRIRLLIVAAVLAGTFVAPLPHGAAQTLPTALNNATSTLASDHTSGSGTLVLATGHGTRFGTPSVDAPVRVTVSRRPTLVNGRIEATTTLTIFDCTARTGDTLSGLTAVEGTSDRNFFRGDPVEAILTAGVVNALKTAVIAKADDATVVKLVTPQQIDDLKSFREATGTGTTISRFGRDNAGTYQPLAEIRTRNSSNPPLGDEIGRGTLHLIDSIDDRTLELTFHEFGASLFTTGLVGLGPFEMAPNTGVVSIRANSGTEQQLSHQLNIRQPADSNGLVLEQGYRKRNLANRIGSWLYCDEAGQSLGLLASDGTALTIDDGGRFTVGGRPFDNQATPVDVRAIAGQSDQTASVALGFWSPPDATGFEIVDYRIHRKAGATADLVIGPASGATPTDAKCLQVNADGSWGVGATPDNAYKLKVNGALSVTDVTYRHAITTGAAPTLEAGAGAGTGPTLTISGTDAAGTVTVTTGTAPVGFANTVFRVNFAVVYAVAPRCVTVTPANANAAALANDARPWWAAATTNVTKFDVVSGSTGLAATTTYTWAYQVTQ